MEPPTRFLNLTGIIVFYLKWSKCPLMNPQKPFSIHQITLRLAVSLPIPDWISLQSPRQAAQSMLSLSSRPASFSLNHHQIPDPSTLTLSVISKVRLRTSAASSLEHCKTCTGQRYHRSICIDNQSHIAWTLSQC